MEKVYVYVDEFGTHSLNESDPQHITHFIYCSVVIKESNLNKAYEVRQFISDNFLNGHVIKSGSKALRDKNIERRISILKHLVSELDFVVYCLVVDKKELEGEGFKYKEVFYKFFQKTFFGQLKNNFEEFVIHADNIISPAYASEMKAYLKNKLGNSLFDNYSMSDDKDEPLIQLADFVAGTLGRIFSNSNRHEKWNILFDIIKEKLSTPLFYPYNNREYVVYDVTKVDFELDNEILNIVNKDAQNYIDNSEDPVKVVIIEYLLYIQKVSPAKLVQTYELINLLKNELGIEISVEQLRLHIRDVRYRGVMIVSALGKSGYKLACNKADILQYFSHYMKYVLPMLQKVGIANDIFKGKTTGEFIPLNDSELDVLKKLVESLSKPNY